MNATSSPYVFHAFERSYFSAKVRPALRAKKLWYDEIRADVRVIRELSGLTFIPIVVTPEGEVLQDTSEILDALEVRHPEPPLFPAAPFARAIAYLIELYADEFGLVPAMHYRWGSERGEADARAGFAAMIGSEVIGNKAADAMTKARLAVGATDDTADAIEDHTHDLLSALASHFGQHPFLLGDRLSLADCAMMGPLYAHLFNDVVSRPILLEQYSPVAAWIERCNHPGADSLGSFLGDAELGKAIAPVLRAMGIDAMPTILAATETIQDWADANPGECGAPPRAVGIGSATFRGKTLRQAVRPYTLWMVQRTIEALPAAGSPERDALAQCLEGTGFEPLLDLELRWQAGKRERQIVLEPRG